MNFVTFFDYNYLDRGLVLYDSLESNTDAFKLFVVCLDEKSEVYLKKLNLSGITVISLKSIEEKYEILANVKNSRSLIEYYFTLSPFCPLYCIEQFQIESICSLDADIVFYSDPKFYFDKLVDYSIVITPHKFSPENKSKCKYGDYNVSFQIFNNDEIGVSCLKSWCIDCIDWCNDFLDVEKNRFADQLYLNDWKRKYGDSVFVINDSVGGLAPWNLNNYQLTNKRNLFFSNNERLIFYHFHDFKLYHNFFVFHSFQMYNVMIYKEIISLYHDYFKKVKLKRTEIGGLVNYNIRYSDKGFKKRLKDNEFFFLGVGDFFLINVDKSFIGKCLRYLIKKHGGIN